VTRGRRPGRVGGTPASRPSTARPQGGLEGSPTRSGAIPPPDDGGADRKTASIIRIHADEVLVVATCECGRGINAVCTRREVGGPLIGACPLCGIVIEVNEREGGDDTAT
jgi:hypothetical protein